jgi:integrase
MDLTHVTPAIVERVARQEADKRGWSPRTEGALLRYLVDAFAFAQRKLKWVEERENLSAVEIPRSKRRVAAYTVGEARRLLPALEAVDPRAGWIGYVAVQTGRRLRAIRTLPRSAVTLHDGFAVLAFPAETDKAGKEGEAVVTGRAFELTRRMMEGQGRHVIGREPPANSLCNEWIREAERSAGVEHEARRGWHGLKRLFATLAQGMVGRDWQSGTTGHTLDRIYVRDDLPPKVNVAEALARRIEGE